MSHTKRSRTIEKQLKGRQPTSTLQQAVEALKACPPTKFDQSVEVALQLGIDTKKSDQNVRGTVALPAGTGKTKRVLVLAKGAKLEEAKKAGADLCGAEELIEKIAGGWTDFDVVIAVPELMREVGKLGKVLGPRGLMPTPKAGTVTTDIAKAVQEIQGGKIEFKADRYGIVNSLVGKLSFTAESLVNNIRALFHAVQRSKPATAKGQYFASCYLSSTMGPGIRIDASELVGAA